LLFKHWFYLKAKSWFLFYFINERCFNFCLSITIKFDFIEKKLKAWLMLILLVCVPVSCTGINFDIIYLFILKRNMIYFVDNNMMIVKMIFILHILIYNVYSISYKKMYELLI